MLGSVREHTPYFVVHLEPILGKVFKPEKKGLGKKIKRYRRIIITDNEAITICSIVERKVGVYKEIEEGDNNL